MTLVRPHTIVFGIVLVAAGCVDPLTTHAVSTPEWDVKNVRGYVETAIGAPDTALGWGLTVAGDVARWHECTSIDSCGGVERDCPARDLLAVAPVGHAALPDGTPVEVMKLSLSPRPRYVVPITKAQ